MDSLREVSSDSSAVHPRDHYQFTTRSFSYQVRGGGTRFARCHVGVGPNLSGLALSIAEG